MQVEQKRACVLGQKTIWCTEPYERFEDKLC